MKCTSCGADVRLKDRPSRACPSCGQRFVTEPTEDGITDRFLERAVEVVSGEGTFYFLESQLTYEIKRRALRKRDVMRRWRLFAGLLALVIAIAAVMTALPLLIFAAFLAVVAFGVSSAGTKWDRVHGEADQWARKWLEAHPNDKLVRDETPRPWRDGDANGDSLGDVSFDRVVVCQREELVDLFLLNQFHFHYSCPVLGAEKYPEPIYDTLIDRLRANESLTVVVLHDMSPEGRYFARQVENDPKWFGGASGAKVVDAGLLPEQQKMFSGLMMPLAPLGLGAGAAHAGDVAGELAAEIDLFRPELLTRLTGSALDAGMPFHLLPDPYMGDTGGYG